VQATTIATSFRNELVATTIEELEPIKGGAKLAIVSCTLPLPVEVLEELVTPKPIPLVILDIGVGVKVTLIDNITNAFEVFKILDMILKDTHVAKGQGPQPVPLVEPIDTTCE